MIATQTPSHVSTGTPMNVPLDLIDPHPQQPRRLYDEAELTALADSLRLDNVMQRPLVREMPDGRYQLVAGERRCRAARLLGWTAMPVVVRDLDDLAALRMLGTENLVRADWTPIEVAQYIDSLCQPLEKGGAGMTTEEAGSVFGKSPTWARKHRGMLKLPDVWQQRITSGEITSHNAAALLAYCDRPGLLAAFDENYRKAPWAWQSREDFKRNIELIAATPRRRKKARQVDGKPMPLRPVNVEKQTDRISEKLTEQPNMANFVVKHTKIVSENQACRMLRPHIGCRDSLVMIRDTCERLIHALHAEPAEATA